MPTTDVEPALRSPVSAYTSKKYYILGHVNQKGVFPLDRPVSVIEAIAKARGFVSTFPQRNEWVQADLSRSFLVRRGADGLFARVWQEHQRWIAATPSR